MVEWMRGKEKQQLSEGMQKMMRMFLLQCSLIALEHYSHIEEETPQLARQKQEMAECLLLALPPSVTHLQVHGVDIERDREAINLIPEDQRETWQLSHVQDYIDLQLISTPTQPAPVAELPMRRTP